MADKGRIAVLLPDMGAGGAERVALTLMKGFIEHGHSVDLVLMKAKGELLGEVSDDVRVIDLGADRIRDAMMPLVRYLRRDEPDSLLANLWPLTVIAIFSGKLARSGTAIVTIDHNRLSTQYRDSRWLGWSLRTFYPKATARVVVSAGIADDLAYLSGLPRNRFTIIHNPVEPSSPKPADVEMARTQWPGQGKRILAVGTLKPQKNYSLLLKAMEMLDAEASLLILGEGGERGKLEQMIGELDLGERVKLAGFVADTAPYYSAADLFVLSSDHEGFGNVIVEALHAGLPVVSTDCPSGPAEILDDGRYGMLVPCGDANALTVAMQESLARGVDGKRQSKRGQDFVPEHALQRYLALHQRG